MVRFVSSSLLVPTYNFCWFISLSSWRGAHQNDNLILDTTRSNPLYKSVGHFDQLIDNTVSGPNWPSLKVALDKMSNATMYFKKL